MKKFKRLIALLTVAMFLLSFAPAAFAADPAADAFARLKDLGVVAGGTGGDPMYDKAYTRAEAAAVMVKLQGKTQADIDKAKGGTAFSDVDSSHWASGVINLAVAAGIIKGYPDGTYKPEKEVSYAEMAAMFVQALKFGSDLQGTYPNNVIVKAAQLGIFNGLAVSDFSSPVVRKDLFVAGNNVADTKAKDSDTTVAEVLKPTPVATISSVAAVTGTVTEGEAYTLPSTVSATYSDGTTKDVAVTWASAADTSVAGTFEIAGTVEGFDAGAKATLTVNAGPLAVSSVTAVNAGQVEVKFNRELYSSSVTAAAFSVNKGITITTVKLGDDKKTVTVTTSALANSTDYEMTINTNIKDSAQTKLAANVVKSFSAFDATVPTVVSVAAKGNSAIKITFSEPIANLATAANYKVNNIVYAGVPVASTDGTSVELPVTMPLGDNKVELVQDTFADLADLAGYKVPGKVYTFAVDAGTTVTQAVEATVLDQNTVQVKFDNPVVLAESTNYTANFYWNANGTTGYTQYPADAVPAQTTTVKKVDDQTFKVQFTQTANYLKPGTVYFFVTGVTDYFGNTVPTKKFELTVAGDALPTVTKTEATDEKTFKITFDKALDSSTVTYSNFTLKNSSGTAKTISTVGYASKVVTVTVSSNLDGGEYTIEYKNLKSVTGNALAAGSVTATVTDKTAISSITIGPVDDGTNDYILVTYPEAMATSGDFAIGIKAKYTVDVAGGGYNALATADEIEVIDSKTVKIKFDSSASKFGAQNITVKVKLVADAAGNIISNEVSSGATAAVSSATGKYDISDIDGAGTKLAAKFTDLKTIEMTFGRKLTSISASDFIVRNVTDSSDIIPSAATYTNSTSGSTSTVKLTLPADASTSKTYAVKTNATVGATKDINYLTLVANVQGANATFALAPTLKNVSYQDSTHLVAVFSTNMDLVVASDFKVSNGTNTYTATLVADTADGTGAAAAVTNVVADKEYVLTFGSAISSAYKLSTVAAPQSEANGSKLPAVTDMAISDFKVASVQLKNKSGNTAATIENGDSIVLTFSEAVKASDLIADIDPYMSTVNAATKWDGSEQTFDAGNFVVLTNVGAANDTITFANGMGTINLGAADTVTATTNVSDVKVALSDDGLTMTITFTTAGAAAAAANVTEANISSAKFTPAKTLKASSGAYADSEYVTYTASQF